MPRTAALGPLIALCAVTLSLSACGRDKEASTEQGAPAGARLATLEVGVEAAPAEIRVDGVVEAVQQATLSAQTAGRVTEVAVDVNDRVAGGALLMRLRAAEQTAGLAQSQAALRAAAAQDAQARAQFQRIDDMYQRKVVARATYDEALAARDAAAAGLAAARASLESAREGVAYTEVRAPFAGVITAKRAQIGEAVVPGTPLVTVSGVGELRVVAELPQAAVDQVRAQPKARVYVGDRTFESASVLVFPSAEPTSSTFRVRVKLPQPTEGLAPGMFAKVGFVTGEASRILVPLSAVVERSELRAVYVVGPDDRVALRQVRLGRAVGDRIEVIAGLARGERVATDPAQAGIAARPDAASRND
jgi:RND family efflux transporter MFP subunit